MEARTTRRPGQKGTKRLLQRFGDRLLFIRYRYDPAGRRRVTTVELIVDEQPWAPRPDTTLDTAAPLPRPANPSDLVALRIAAHELELRTRVKGAGGKWDVTRRAWILPLRRVRVLALEDRIVSAGS
jgi:hypothetical protein